MPNFNKQNARRLFRSRPLNVAYDAPQPGQTWYYFDAEGEGLVEWLFLSTAYSDDTKLLEVQKLTGKDKGYRVLWDSARMGTRWWPKEETGLKHYLWCCPDCGGDKPVYPGDYVCEDCRESLDT